MCSHKNLSQSLYRRELKLLNQREITNNTLPTVPRVKEQRVRLALSLENGKEIFCAPHEKVYSVKGSSVSNSDTMLREII